METYSPAETNSDFKKEQRVKRALEAVINWYKLPETFINDSVNLALLEGACEKILNSQDPLYKKRIKNFIKALASNESGKNRLPIDKDRIGVEGRGVLSPEEQDRYLQSIKDENATEDFVLKYGEKIKKAIASWKQKGYDLEIETFVVNVDSSEFYSKTGGAAFVDVPSQTDLKLDSKNKVTFALIKGKSDNEKFVNHELYHVEDYFDFIRRGKDGFILESLDELHTEYMVRNYSNDTEITGGYHSIKDFWNKLSFVGDLDFNLLTDRKKLLEKVVEEFGKEGLISFCLIGAQPNGQKKLFETFINKNERAILEMLISKEKNNINNLNNYSRNSLIDINSSLKELKDLLTPNEGDVLPEFKSIYDLIQSKNKNLFFRNELVSANKTKNLLSAYCKACAYLEKYYSNETTKDEELYKLILESINQIPFRKKNPYLSLNDEIIKKVNDSKKYNSFENDQALERVSKKLFFDLCYELGSIDFAFSLNNPDLKNNILNSFLIELDKIASYCINHENPNVKKWFIEGMGLYNLTFEILYISKQYLKNKFKELPID